MVPTKNDGAQEQKNLAEILEENPDIEDRMRWYIQGRKDEKEAAARKEKEARAAKVGESD